MITSTSEHTGAEWSYPERWDHIKRKAEDFLLAVRALPDSTERRMLEEVAEDIVSLVQQTREGTRSI